MAETQFRAEQDRSSGRVHKRYADEQGQFRLVDERCQRDQSGAYEVIALQAESTTSDDRFCKYCFSHDQTTV